MSSRTRWPHRRGAVVAWLLVLGQMGVAGCMTVSDEDDKRDLWAGRQLDGPLSASVEGGGGGAVNPPIGARSTVKASFGSFVLCVNDDAPAVIDALRLSADGFQSPMPTATFWVRHVDPGANDSPVAFLLGSPPSFTESYAASKPAGKWEPFSAGRSVDLPCPAAASAAAQGFDEIFVTLSSNEGRGVVAEGFDIAYSISSQRYTLHVDWTMVICGSQLKDEFYCKS